MTIALTTRPDKVKLRVEDFDLLAESDALRGMERSELLDGDIYLMAAQYRLHGFAKSVFHEALIDWARAHRPDLRVLSEVSVAMPPIDEPIPDVTLTSEPRGPRGIPVASVALLIEVADESRDYDLGYKAELYARQGVPEYWVVDLQKRVVVVHAAPGEAGYGHRAETAFGGVVAGLTLPGLSVATGELA